MQVRIARRIHIDLVGALVVSEGNVNRLMNIADPVAKALEQAQVDHDDGKCDACVPFDILPSAATAINRCAVRRPKGKSLFHR